MEAKNWTQLSKSPELMEATPLANGYASVGSHKCPCNGCTVQKQDTDEQHGRASASAEEEDAEHCTPCDSMCSVQNRQSYTSQTCADLGLSGVGRGPGFRQAQWSCVE